MREWWAKVNAVFTNRRTIGDDLDEEIEADLHRPRWMCLVINMPDLTPK